MIHPLEITEGELYKPGYPIPLSQILCQLHQNNSKEHECRSWQGTLAATWKPWDLCHVTLEFGACISQLSDGRRALVFPSSRVEGVCRTVMDLESIANVGKLAEPLGPGIGW